MIYYVEESLSNFQFWSGALQRTQYLDEEDFDIIEDVLESDGHDYSDTEINDLFWFDENFIAQILGYDTFDDLIKDREEN